MAVLPPAELIRAAQAQGGPDALRNIPPIAFSAKLLPGFDPADPTTLLEPSMIVTPVVHPLLEALLEVSDATRRGSLTWSIGLGEDANTIPLGALMDAVTPGTIVVENAATGPKGPKDLKDYQPYRKDNDIAMLLLGTPAGAVLNERRRALLRQPFPVAGPASFGAVTLSTEGRSLYMKVVTHHLTTGDDDSVPPVALNLRPAGKPRTDPKPMRPAEVISVLEWASTVGFTVVDPSENGDVAALRRTLASALVAWPAPGRPAEAMVTIGRKVYADVPTGLPIDRPISGRATSSGRVTADEVAALAAELDPSRVVLHPAVADAGRLAHAKPVDDERLRDYQRDAVGLHVTTSVGFVNVCAPGMGKTVMTLEGMRRRAADRPGYRALVVVEANVRTQWTAEATRWFPTAHVVTVESRSQAGVLADTLAAAGDSPVLVITSYGLLAAVKEAMDAAEAGNPVDVVAEGNHALAQRVAWRAKCEPETPLTALISEELAAALATAKPAPAGQLDLFGLSDGGIDLAPAEVIDAEPSAEETPVPVHLGQLLLDVAWHDIAADEAEVLRGTGSKQAAALWQLRDNSEVAIALTGTPINRGLDDLGRLVSWVRGDRTMFNGVRLSTQFDLSDPEQLADYAKALGPIVFRRDDSEIADELPTIKPVVMRLEPSVAERNLASAARNELKRVYDELLSWLQMVEATDPGNPAYAQARESLTAARGAWLGGTTLARMASSDPAALLTSTSAGAALLAGQGLIAAATAQPGTKRTAVVADVADRVAAGEKVLVFTEFATVARGIIDDLDARGVAVGGVLGGEGRKRDRQIAEFQNGQLDVLVCTSSGERGLNLQQATTIVHYDLPWTPKGIIQRTGRAKRIGATSAHVTVVFPIMVGTIEERVASLVVARAVTAMQALDGSRGVDAANSEMGLALGGLVAAVSTDDLGKKDAAMLQMTRDLLAA